MVKVQDNKVWNVWVCDDPLCTCEEKNPQVRVNPDFYSESGNPVCECDSEMVYSHTEVEEDILSTGSSVR
jgi:hypothetical protein